MESPTKNVSKVTLDKLRQLSYEYEAFTIYWEESSGAFYVSLTGGLKLDANGDNETRKIRDAVDTKTQNFLCVIVL